MKLDIIEKYNVPVPRYTSYPPANFFTDQFSAKDYTDAINISNKLKDSNISVYIHIPFCRHLCHYCGCNSYPMGGKQKIAAYIDALKSEMDLVFSLLDSNRKISQIHYGGGSPTTLSTDTLAYLNEQILARFPTIDKPEIAIECHPGYLDEAYWHGLTEAGFNRVSIGVQDFNEDVLTGIHRRASLLPLDTVFDILRASGVRINLDFIYGLPLQTTTGFSETISRAIDLSPDRVVTFSYAHVPWVNKNMLKLEALGLPSHQTKKALFDGASQLLQQAGYKAIGMDHFVKQDDELWQAYQDKKLHRNFQGYCTKQTTGEVYALGVSGISQLSGAFAQNTKELDKYVSTLLSGNLATEKGYRLTLHQEIVGKLINMLMCNECIQWSELALLCGLSEDKLKKEVGYPNAQIEAFVRDNIVTITPQGLFMTPQGQIFVRNVAAAFDPLLKEGIQSYSKPI